MFQKTTIACLLFFSITTMVKSQQFYTTYDWEPTPSYSIEDSNKDIVALKDKIVTEFYFEGETFVEYFMEHRILWLNSDDRIEEYNKIYLPYSSDSKLEVNKARVIKKNGEVLELDESKILTADDEETGKKYKYFAFEGVEKGSFIEYYYVVKRSPSYQGRRLSFQAGFDKINVEFDLFSPKNLIFDFKSYNNIPEVTRDTTSVDKLHWSFALKNLKGVDKESQSPYNASRGFVIYKLDKNTYNNKTITSYSNVAQNLYSFYYPTYDDQSNKLIEKLIPELKITDEMDEEAKARKIDLYIKENVFLSEAGNDHLKDLNSVITNKTANETGLVKLYVALFRKLNVQHEMVLTSDRLNIKFDKEFEANNFLNEFLFYFPKSKKYLAPSEFDTRFGFPPAYHTDNYGLFIKEVTVGTYKSGVSKIKYIPAIEAELSTDEMIIDVQFNKDDFTQNTIKLDRTMNGYYAMYIQPFTNLIPPDKKDEFLDTSFAKSLDKDAEVTKRTVINGAPELFGMKPYIIKFEITSESFVEKAGNKYLFKLGDLIGPQMEMYQEKKRALPLESEFNRSYLRTITVHIPDGYKITNADDINIKNVYSKEGKDIFVFDSYYKLDGNVLTVTADEHYRETIVAPENYEEYRKVINSAADFNKITLVLEKK